MGTFAVLAISLAQVSFHDRCCMSLRFVSNLNNVHGNYWVKNFCIDAKFNSAIQLVECECQLYAGDSSVADRWQSVFDLHTCVFCELMSRHVIDCRIRCHPHASVRSAAGLIPWRSNFHGHRRPSIFQRRVRLHIVDRSTPH